MATSKKTTYTSVRTNCQKKIEAFRTIINNAAPSSAKSGATATQLNSFSKWIDKGAIVQNVSNTQLNRWAGKTRKWTVGAAKTTLSGKFGKSAIKAVAPSKTGGFIVATSAIVKGRSFSFSH